MKTAFKCEWVDQDEVSGKRRECEKKSRHFFKVIFIHSTIGGAGGSQGVYVLRCDEHMKLTHIDPKVRITKNTYIVSLIMDE